MTKIGNAYRWLHGDILQRPINFSWVVDSKLAGCRLPTTREECKWLEHNGNYEYNNCSGRTSFKNWIMKNKIEYLHLNVDDFSSPTIDELNNTVDYMIDQVGEDKPKLVHCLAGKGRRDCISWIYNKERKDQCTEGNRKVRILRPGSIQTDQQENTLYHYEKFH